MKFSILKLTSFPGKYDVSVLSIQTLLLISICLFFTGIASGLILPPERFAFLSGQISSLEQLAQNIHPFQVSTLIFIYLKNVLAVLVSLILSPLLCLVPISTLLLNGWMISFVSLPLVQSGYIPVLIAGILPHGIFEIPAFILGEAIAIGFGLGMLSMLIKRDWSRMRVLVHQSFCYLVIVILLLIPAAFIETFITPLLIVKFL